MYQEVFAKNGLHICPIHLGFTSRVNFSLDKLNILLDIFFLIFKGGKFYKNVMINHDALAPKLIINGYYSVAFNMLIY